MRRYFCQPCQNQHIEVEADHWCKDCDECLCSLCHDYHKALKITRDHKILSISDYLSISHLLDKINKKCLIHPNEDIEHFCSDHDLACCIFCKCFFHASCSNIFPINDFASNGNLVVETEVLLKSYELLMNKFERGLSNRFKNIEEMNRQRDNFINDLKKNRMEILSLFDVIESSLTEKFDKEWKLQHDKLENQMQYLKQKIKNVKEKRNLLLKGVYLNVLSKAELFLVAKDLQKQSEHESDEITKYIKSMQDVSCVYPKPTFECYNCVFRHYVKNYIKFCLHGLECGLHFLNQKSLSCNY